MLPISQNNYQITVVIFFWFKLAQLLNSEKCGIFYFLSADLAFIFQKNFYTVAIFTISSASTTSAASFGLRDISEYVSSLSEGGSNDSGSWMILPGAFADDLPRRPTSANQVPESDLQNICGARARVSGARLVR